MQVNDDAMDLIKAWEGLRLEAYLCPAGVWTIGYGHTGPAAYRGAKIDEHKAHMLLETDVAMVAQQVAKLLKRPATSNQFGAFVSLAFNIGIGAFKGSTALRRFNAGDLQGAAEAITWWNKATVNGKKQVLRGLVNRREDERILFLSTDDMAPIEKEPEGPIEGGAAKPIVKSKTAWGGFAALVMSALSAASEFVQDFPIPPKYLMLAVVGVAGFLIVNRIVESQKGEH